MNTKHKLKFMLALFLFGMQSANASNALWIWNGSVDNSWNNKNNWTTIDGDGAIGSADSVEIPSGLTTYPRINNNAGNPVIAFLDLKGGYISLNGKTLTVTGPTYFHGGTLENLANSNSTLLMDDMIVNFSGIISVPSGVHLEVWTGAITFINGIINNGYYLLIKDDVTVSGASHQSHMMGAVSKVGDDAFIFPVGSQYYYAPFTISAPANVGHHYTVQYFGTQYTDVSVDNTLNHISQVEYWTMDAINGASAVDVGLSWFNPRSGEIDEVSDLTVAVYDGTDWTAIGSTPSGSNKTGLVTGNVSSFNNNIYTIGSVSSLNPLPVKLFDFKALKTANSVLIEWKTASEYNSDYFDVEKSEDGISWTAIGQLKAAGNTEALSLYSFEDLQPVNGVQFYRLKQVDINGAFVYSASVQIVFGLNNTIKIYPQPAVSDLQVQMQEGTAIEQISVYNAMGQKVLELNSIETDAVSLDLSGLSNGIYMLEVRSEGKMSAMRIFKQ